MNLALIAVAQDKPGLAKALGEAVHKCGGNIETSRMVTLGREFVISTLVTGIDPNDTGTVDTLTAALNASGFEVMIRPTGDPMVADNGLPYRVRAVSLDHPGIVEALADTIRAAGGNIVDANTDVSNAPWSGAPTFSFQALVLLPDAESARALRSDLDDLGVRENLDITLDAHSG